jgi:hypothetical protein
VAVVAAVLTGFGAATLKHRWDVRADDQRWARERAERRREELRRALLAYFESIRQVGNAGTSVIWAKGALDRAMQHAYSERTDQALEQAKQLQVEWGQSVRANSSALINCHRARDALALVLDCDVVAPFRDYTGDVTAWYHAISSRHEPVPYPDDRSVMAQAYRILQDESEPPTPPLDLWTRFRIALGTDGVSPDRGR